MKKDTKLPTFNQYETVSPATKLLQKRRKMYEIHEAFELQKDQFKNQESQFKEDEHKITQRDQQLQVQLINFCQFLQENESKRKKTQEKFRLEQKSYAEKEEQIRNLEKEINQLSRNQKKYMNRVGHLRKYEEYLETVRSTYTDQYPEMSDILNRYQTLKKSNEQLINRRQLMQAEHQILKRQTLNEQKQLNHSILTINNQLKEVSRKIENRINQKNELQSQVQKSNEDFSNKNLNLGKIFMAIDNLNYRCNESSHRMKYQFDDKGNVEKKEVKNKKIEGQIGNARHDQELSYEQRSKQASQKLKSIISHMRDFKSIIDDYQKQYKHAKPDKGQKY